MKSKSKKAKKTKTKGQKRADRVILDTAPSPNPDAPSNKANIEQNKKIKEDAEANE